MIQSGPAWHGGEGRSKGSRCAWVCAIQGSCALGLSNRRAGKEVVRAGWEGRTPVRGVFSLRCHVEVSGGRLETPGPGFWKEVQPRDPVSVKSCLSACRLSGCGKGVRAPGENRSQRGALGHHSRQRPTRQTDGAGRAAARVREPGKEVLRERGRETSWSVLLEGGRARRGLRTVQQGQR